MPIEPKAWREQVTIFLEEIIPTQRGFERQLRLEEDEGPHHPVPLLRSAVARYAQVRAIAEQLRNSLDVLIELGVPPLPNFSVNAATQADLNENNTEIAMAMAHLNTDLATGGTFTVETTPLSEE